jgi:endonuclease/exonuclease/phosphatase (EEP) superfamily protein YafD
MTFNGLFSNQDCDSVADIILSHLPDMVALQEVQPEMMAAWQTRLGETYPNSLLGFENDYGTTAVFSRHPFIEQTIVDLLADRPATIVTVMVDGKKITFAAVHLLAYGLQWYTPPEIPDVIKQRTQDQNRQADLLLATLENHDGVAIIACDCNSKETSSSYRILNQHMRNAAGEVGRQIKRWKPGTSPDINLQHIDYVFYRGDLTPTTVYLVEDGGGSDHKPVVTDFKLGG